MTNKSVEIIQQAQEVLGKRGTLLFLTPVGSKLYGTQNEYSDTDYRGVYIPSLDSILTGTFTESIDIVEPTEEKNTEDDIDFQLWSYDYFLRQVVKGETNGLDMLFSMLNYRHIYKHRDFTIPYKRLLTKNIKSFLGFALRQAQTYGVRGLRYKELQNLIEHTETLQFSKLEEAFDMFEIPSYKYVQHENLKDKRYIRVLDKLYPGEWSKTKFLAKLHQEQEQYGERAKKSADGVDWKALSHAVRVLFQCHEFLETKFIKFPLKEADLIKGIKEQHLTLKECTGIIEYMMLKIDIASSKCTLRESVPREESDGDIAEYIKDFYGIKY